MSFKTLISVQALHENIDSPDWVVVDCRFYLGKPSQCGQL